MLRHIKQNEILEKCYALMDTGIWASHSKIRPEAWLNNFEDEDIGIAALLLDNFVYYSEKITDELFKASYLSLCDSFPKGPSASTAAEIGSGLKDCIFTLVSGETPNITDSGYNFCRKARQNLYIPQDLCETPSEALAHAEQGKCIVFFDDFICSGDQFLEAWKYDHGHKSFQSVHSNNGFQAIYVSVLATDYGLQNIHKKAPTIAISTAHTLDASSTYKGIISSKHSTSQVHDFLLKYSDRILPTDPHMSSREYKAFGYKRRGLMFGFEHCVPDATLPVFWAPGVDKSWSPLVERT